MILSKLSNSNVGIKTDGEIRIYERISVEFSYFFRVYGRIDGFTNESKIANSNVGIKTDSEIRIYERISVEFSYFFVIVS